VRASSLSAQAADRPVVAPDWLIVLLASMVCAALWLLYPRQDLERRLSDAADSPLSLAYLTNLLRSDTDNPQLRLLLARHQVTHGDWADARTTLQPALASSKPAIRRDALWVQWELSHAEYEAVPKTKSARKEVLLQDLRQQLRILAEQQWPADKHARLLALTTQFNEPSLTAALSSQIPTEPPSPQEAAETYVRAARAALAKSDYAGCASYYLLARQATPDPQQAKQYYFSAVRALQSGNEPVAALALAEHELGELKSDREALLFLTNLARAAGRPDIAERYVRQLLKLALSHRWFDHGFAGPTALATKVSANLRRVAWQAAPQAFADRTTVPRYDDGAHYVEAQRRHWNADGNAPSKRLVADKPQAPAPALPYDEEIYTLGYAVFLENHNLEDAWALANAAVRQNPGSVVWRERLAQVSEWTLRLDVALSSWLVVAQQTQKDFAWQAVLRLAPGQFDDAALVDGLRYELRRKPHDRTLVRALVQAWERLGEPQPAIDFLKQRGGDPETIELLAELAERAGQPDLALESWRRLLKIPGQTTPQRAMQAAVLALRRDRADEGLAWLEAARAHPPADASASEFWRLTGQVAESRERTQLAVEAYRKLLKTGSSTMEDYDALVRLLQLDFPIEAAQVSAQAWQQFGEARHLTLALTLLSGRSQWKEFGRLIQQLETGTHRDTLPTLMGNTQFLRLVGTWHQNAGRMAQARRFFENGLRASPDSPDMQQALLWLLIDSNDTVALRSVLATHERTWQRSEAVHDALAASYQALSLPQTALSRYLTPRFQVMQGDFLWLMNYADALDQNQQTDRAWRLRRHLLSREWREAQASAGEQKRSRADALKLWLSQEGLDQTRRVARARLAITQRPGDPAADVLRELLRLDRDANGGYSNAAAETAIGWLQDAGEFTAERAFLWHQYARTRAVRANRPLWADISVALAEDDRAASGQLLERFDERLPRYDRIHAASVAQDIRLAQSAAFNASNDQHDDAPLHLQLTENLLAFSDHAEVKLLATQLGGMNEGQSHATLHWALGPRLTMDLEFRSIQRRSTDARVVQSPPNEERLEAKFRWRHLDGESGLLATNRDGHRNTQPLQLWHEQRVDNRLSWRIEAGRQLPSDESLTLRIAGMKTRAAASVRYQVTRQDEFLLMHAAERYQLQTGATVGSGRHSSIQYTHTYRQDAPLLALSAFWSTHAYTRRDPSDLDPSDLDFRRYLPPDTGALGRDFFLPGNFRFYGIELSTNMRYEEEYSRALRPFASVSRTWHSQLGPGYGVRLGIAGSVWAVDHLSLSLGQSKSGVQSQDRTRDLQLSYRLHF
jgi:hypothetical protein